MKIIFKLSLIFFAVTFIACEKDVTPPDEETPTFEGFKVVDGWIVSPEWLADIVGKSSSGYAHPYIVFLFKYQGKNHICVESMFSSNIYNKGFFTLSGEPIAADVESSKDPQWELWYDVNGAWSETRNILWSTPSESKSTYTRADRKIPGLVKTPHGTPFEEVYIADEMSETEWITCRNYVVNVYPEAEIMPESEPTRLYNCHAYAWHMKEGGTPSPIVVNTPIDAYWGDGSFVGIPGFEPGAKVTYTGREQKPSGVPSQIYIIHSAVAEVSGKVVSKWGPYDLVQHNLDYTPYNDYNRDIRQEVTYKYYKRNTPLVITGPDSPSLNTNVTYSVPTAQNITFNRWEITGGGYTTTSGLNSRNLTIKFTSAATYTLKAIFNLPNNYGTYTATKTVKLSSPPPPAPIIEFERTYNSHPDPTMVYPEESIRVYVTNSTGSETYQWHTNGSITSNYSSRIEVHIPYYPQIYMLEVSCTATKNGISRGSNTISWGVDWNSRPYRIPQKPKDDLKMEVMQ